MHHNHARTLLRRLPAAPLLAVAAVLVAAIAPSSPPDGWNREATQGPSVGAATDRAPERQDRAASTPFKEARIYWEYNASANDLGVHVVLDAEDWKKIKIENPSEKTLFDVKGSGPYRTLGMTELFFEGAEPSLNEVPLAELLEMFPEGDYEFSGKLVGGEELESEAAFSHAIPAGPKVSHDLGANNYLVIKWQEVTSPPQGFPAKKIVIAGYQVIVDSFQVTLPASARSVTVPPEFVKSLGSGTHPFEVLAIEASGNQTLTEGTFVL